MNLLVQSFKFHRGLVRSLHNNWQQILSVRVVPSTRPHFRPAVRFIRRKTMSEFPSVFLKNIFFEKTHDNSRLTTILSSIRIYYGRPIKIRFLTSPLNINIGRSNLLKLSGARRVFSYGYVIVRILCLDNITVGHVD